jgi:hypothetical protein
VADWEDGGSKLEKAEWKRGEREVERDRGRDKVRKRRRRSRFVYSQNPQREMENATRFVIVMPVGQQREREHIKNNRVVYGSREWIFFVLWVRDGTADSHVIAVLDVVPLAVVYPLFGHASEKLEVF